MAVKSWFLNLTDTNLEKDMMIRNPDMFIMKLEFIGQAVLSTPGVTAVLTPTPASSFTIDEFISTVAKNLFIVDDNGKVARGTVDDNDATTITFDSTIAGLNLEEDETSAAALTDTNTYDIYVGTPSAKNLEGPFFGFVEGQEINIVDEFAKFKYSTPRKLRRKDLLERVGTMTGGVANFTNKDVFNSILNSDPYGKQVGQFSEGVGFDPDTNKFYRVTLTGNDVTNRLVTIRIRKAQFESTGNIRSASESGHFMLPFNLDFVVDSFYPVTADLLQIIRAD